MQYNIQLIEYNDTNDGSFTVSTYIVNESTAEAIVKAHDNYYKFKHSSLGSFKQIHGDKGPIVYSFPETVKLIKEVIFSKPVDDIINSL